MKAFDWESVVILLGVFAVVALISVADAIASASEAESRAKAIAACTAHHPPAECEKLWEATK